MLAIGGIVTGFIVVYLDPRGAWMIALALTALAIASTVAIPRVVRRLPLSFNCWRRRKQRSWSMGGIRIDGCWIGAMLDASASSIG